MMQSIFLYELAEKRKLQFKDITVNFLKNLEIEHIGSGYGYNSLSVYLRAIRAIFNRAIKDDEIEVSYDDYPFKHYKIKQTKTRKRAIAKEDIVKIEKYKPAFGSPEFHARNMFMFSFYMIGMNFTDMAYLKFSDIKKNKLEYTRRKTKDDFSIELWDEPEEIIDIYWKNNFTFNPQKPEKDKDSFVFPIIKRSHDRELERMDIKNGLKQMNKYIRRIAKTVGIEDHLTTYVARHSWASIGRALDIPLMVIRDSLGHEDLKTTQIYLDDLDKSEISKATRLITG